MIPRYLSENTAAASASKATTAEATFFNAAGPGVAIDITAIVVSNDQGTANTVTFRSATGGTIKCVVTAGANATVPITFDSAPLPGEINSPWTLSLSAATNVNVTMVGLRRTI